MQMSTQYDPTRTSLALEEPSPTASSDKSNRKKAAFPYSEEDLVRALIIFLLPIVILDALFHAAFKSLWFDEIFTSVVAGQAHVSGMWDSLKHGVDGHPLGFYLVEHVMGRLKGNQRITLRLPSTAAFLCSVSCMFIFIRRRAGSLIALVSSGALLITSLFDPFAFEARPYGLMVACIAVALLCYERADSWKWAAIFAASLAAASSLHFYAAVSFFPFGLAELARLTNSRRFRPQIWLGFLVGILPYVAFWPILQAQRVFYGAHFWATPTFWRFAISMAEVLRLGTGFSVAIFAAAIVYLVYFAYSGEVGAEPNRAFAQGFSLPDAALAVGFLALPIVTFAAAKIAHGGFTGRYVITSALGISIVLGLVLSELKRPVIQFVGLLLICMFAFQEGGAWSFARKAREVKDPMQFPLEVAKKWNVPVVVSDELQFLPMWYAADNEAKSRLFYLADAEQQLLAWGSDSATLQLLKLKDYAPVQVQSFSEFAQNHRRFLLVSDGDARDYRPRLLIEQGFSLRAIDMDPPIGNLGGPDISIPPKNVLYLVDLDEPKRSPGKPGDS
jgi:hypothetical protein